eukprot:212479_1
MDMKRLDAQLRQYSIPLILGIIAGIIFANISPTKYEYIFGTDTNTSHFEILDITLFGYHITSFSFLINDCFMVFFFGFACKGIIESLLPPNGTMYPIPHAITPIVACVFGIITPIIIYITLISIIFHTNATYLSDNYSFSTILNGWAIPTATDISLAWVVASFVFINNNTKSDTHPCISFLLILAIVDDGIGLIIIAIFYTDPNFTVQPLWILLIVAAMALAYVSTRYLNISHWLYYIVFVGSISWIGFLQTRVHPALSLVPIMPFMAIKVKENEYDLSMLDDYQKYLQVFVEYGLFFFTLANAGVTFSVIGWITASIFCAVLFGKTIGIALSTFILHKGLNVSLPNGMTVKQLPMLAYTGCMCLTVALFVSNVAFEEKELREEAKMGALGAASLVMISCIFCRLFCIKNAASPSRTDDDHAELQSLN